MSTLISSNYPCLEHIFMVPNVFESFKFYCLFFISSTTLASPEYFLNVVQGTNQSVVDICS